MVPLLKELGINAKWDIIKGGESFFEVTKKFHNLLHGRDESLGDRDFEVFLETGEKNCQEMNMDGDIVFIHDPQPITLINKRKSKDQKWIWRCHVDVSNPNTRLWEFLQKYIERYDSAVFSAPAFSRPLPIRQFLIAPSIDPLSDKNIELPPEQINKVFEKYQVPRDKPIVIQISRFDYLKDPVGVIEAFRIVKKSIDCRLVLAGGTASDDPEGAKVLAEVQTAAANDPDIHILLMKHNDLEVNALQRGADVVVQKSVKEGFGLTVTEALWKRKPVVAGAVGGIPLQITHRYSGHLCHSIEGAAFGIKQFLNNPAYAKKLAENGHQHAKQNFLLTRHLKEYMLLFLSLYHNDDVVRL